MKILLLAATAIAATTSFASARCVPAYPDYWAGGSPLPPLCGTTVTYVAPTVTTTHRQVEVVVNRAYTGTSYVQVLHPQTILSRERAHAYRDSQQQTVVVYRNY